MKHKPIFLLAVIVLLSACGQSYEEKVRLSRAERARLAQEEAAALKVAVLPTLDCMPVYLAKQKHWYDSTQVDLRLKVRNAQIDCDTALKGKSVEVAVTDNSKSTLGYPLRYAQGALAVVGGAGSIRKGRAGLLRPYARDGA